MSHTKLTIKTLKARAVDAPIARPVRTASGTIPSAPLVLIDVETHQGVTGRSYIFGYTPLTLRPLLALFDELTGIVQGRDVAPVNLMAEFEARFRLLGRQGLLGMAISGLDMAFWDVLARTHDEPLVALLGGTARPLAAYDSYGVVDPDKDRHHLEASLAQGFRAIKIKLGDGDLAWDLDNVSRIRRIIGPDIRLMVDYNQSLSVPEAIERANRLAEHEILWMEEPVPAEDLTGHAKVRGASKISVQTGENWWFPEDAARAIALSASDYAMLDVMKIGGVTGWQRAAAQAEGASLPVSSHLFVEASAHLLAVTPTVHYLEYLDIAGAILAEPLAVRDGCVEARGPGLGIEWDEDAVERYAV